MKFEFEFHTNSPSLCDRLSILLTSNSLWELNVFLGQISSFFSSSEVIFRNDSIWSSLRPRAVFNCALKNSQEPVNISMRRPSVQGAVMSILWLKGTEISVSKCRAISSLIVLTYKACIKKASHLFHLNKIREKRKQLIRIYWHISDKLVFIRCSSSARIS